MESQIATHEDANVILKLYDLRREAVLRKARHWLLFEFNPQTAEEFLAVARGSGSQENAWYRQALSYWEMAASLVLHGAVNADLFFDSNGEGLFIYAKFQAFHQAIEEKSGRPFMRHTAKLIEKYPIARDIYSGMLKSLRSRKP